MPNRPQNMHNLLAENGEALFEEPLQNLANPFEANKVNPCHPCAAYYIKLKNQFPPQSWDKWLDSVISDLRDSSSNNKQPIVSKWKQSSWKCPVDHGPFDNEPDSYAYNNYSYDRYVTELTPCTYTHEKQLLALLSSVDSSIKFVSNLTTVYNCMNCAKCKTSDTIELMADSGASVHLTHVRSDLSEYEVMELDEMPLKTASTEADPLYASGKGSMFLSISGIHKGKEAPVYYVVGLSHRYLSVGTLLSQGLELVSDKSFLEFRTLKAYQPVFQCMLHSPGQSVYWLSVKISSAHSLLAKSIIMNIDYDIMHR